jgi:hypothetical protein
MAWCSHGPSAAVQLAPDIGLRGSRSSKIKRPRASSPAGFPPCNHSGSRKPRTACLRIHLPLWSLAHLGCSARAASPRRVTRRHDRTNPRTHGQARAASRRSIALALAARRGAGSTVVAARRRAVVAARRRAVAIVAARRRAFAIVAARRGTIVAARRGAAFAIITARRGAARGAAARPANARDTLSELHARAH